MSSRKIGQSMGVIALSLVIVAGTAWAQDAKQPSPKPVKLTEEQIQALEKMAKEKIKSGELDNQSIKVDPKMVGQPEVPVPTGPGGTITFENTKVDFGAIPDDKTVKHTFKFTNTGEHKLVFTQQPRGSCGCTVPNLSKMEYAPGESGEITVEFNPKGKRDKAHTQVTVMTNDPAKPTITLDVNADVKVVFRAEPPSLAVGSAERGQTVTQKIALISRKPDLTVLQATPNSPRLSVNVLPSKQVEENGEMVTRTELEVSIAKDAMAGPLQEGITVRTSDPNNIITVFVTGEIVGLVQPSPNRLSFQMLSPSQPMMSRVMLNPRGGKPFKVTGVVDQPATSPTAQVFKFDVKENTSTTPTSWEIIGTGTAPPQPGRVSGEWVITTDLPDEPQVRIRYDGFVRQAPAAQVPQDAAWQQQPSTLIPSGG